MDVQTVMKYAPLIAKHILRNTPKGGQFDGYQSARVWEINTLAALFAHLRCRPHESPVEDFNAEFSEALNARNIRSILEVGGGDNPFIRVIAPFTSPDTTFYSFGLDDWPSSIDRKHVYGQGDLLYFARWLPESRFDLILSIGVHSSAGTLYLMDDLETQIEKNCDSARQLVARLSNNPSAAFFVSSWNMDVLSLSRQGLGQNVNILFWQFLSDENPHALRRRDIFYRSGIEPATLAVMQRKSG